MYKWAELFKKYQIMNKSMKVIFSDNVFLIRYICQEKAKIETYQGDGNDIQDQYT